MPTGKSNRAECVKTAIVPNVCRLQAPHNIACTLDVGSQEERTWLLFPQKGQRGAMRTATADSLPAFCTG